MKRILIVIVFLILGFIFVSNSYAQELNIVNIKGSVLLRQREVSPWREAKVGEKLFKDCELLTKEKSECTISFDNGLGRSVVIKENSQLKVADIAKGSLELSQGRVFALVDHNKTNEIFTIKTPTAVAGPRGSGWSVSFINKITTAICLQGGMHVDGLDSQGNVVSQQDVAEGFGLEVFQDGSIGELFRLAESDQREWNQFMNFIDTIVTDSGEKFFTEEDRENLEELRDMRDDQREDLREEVIKELRDREESGSSKEEDSPNHEITNGR